MNEALYIAAPVNKIAAIVASQAGCSSGELTPEEYRQNLVKKVQFLNRELRKYGKKSDERRSIGMDLCRLNTEINAIRPKKSCKGVQSFFMDAAREILPSFQFNRIMDRAVLQKNEADKEV